MVLLSQRIIEAKDAADNLQNLVLGYIKFIQKSNESLNNIPTEIFYLCILFLFQRDYFDVIGVDIGERNVENIAIYSNGTNSFEFSYIKPMR